MEESVQFSLSVMSDSLRPSESQHARPPCPSPTPGVHSDSRPSSQWCHPAISSWLLQNLNSSPQGCKSYYQPPAMFRQRVPITHVLLVSNISSKCTIIWVAYWKINPSTELLWRWPWKQPLPLLKGGGGLPLPLPLETPVPTVEPAGGSVQSGEISEVVSNSSPAFHPVCLGQLYLDCSISLWKVGQNIISWFQEQGRPRTFHSEHRPWPGRPEGHTLVPGIHLSIIPALVTCLTGGRWIQRWGAQISKDGVGGVGGGAGESWGVLIKIKKRHPFSLQVRGKFIWKVSWSAGLGRDNSTQNKKQQIKIPAVHHGDRFLGKEPQRGTSYS